MNRSIFAARLYGSGSPEAGAPVRLAWREQWLVVTGADAGEPVLHTVRVGDLQAAARGFNNSQIALTWAGGDGEHMLVLASDAAAAFRHSAPVALQQRLHPVQKAQRRTEHHFRWGIAALVVALSLPLLALVAFIAWVDPLADWVVRRLPASIEQQMGEAVLAQTRAQSKMVESGPAFDAVQAIAGRLAKPEERLRFYVADRPEVNAFAAPGGVVVVYTGLLRAADSAEEVAGVLAHEIAHVELRHSLRQLVKVAGLKALLSAVLGDYGQLAGWSAQLTELKFSRDAEREADTRGLARLIEARVAPRGLPRFFAKLEKAEGSETLPTLLSTHPATGERLVAMEAAIVERGAVVVEPIAVAWEPVRAALTPGAK